MLYDNNQLEAFEPPTPAKTLRMGTPKKNHFEKLAAEAGLLVCGIDEAGRGCLAGPVVVAAVILRSGARSNLVKDSKKLTATEREKAFAWIRKHGHYAVSFASPSQIDQYNIFWATSHAMRSAYLALIATMPDKLEQLAYVLTDAMPITVPTHAIHPNLGLHCFPHGEDHSLSIAAASIVAKVTRDALMTRLHQNFPSYGFDEHKGYGTKKHQQALKVHGQSIIHRVNFAPELLKSTPAEEQHSLFELPQTTSIIINL